MHLRVLDAAQVRLALPMPAAIEAMKVAYRTLSTGESQIPLRSRLEAPEGNGVTLLMPAAAAAPPAMALKVVSVFPSNPELGLPTIHALVLAIDPATGVPLAILEGGALTAIRTGAASGAATDILARPDSRIAAIIGSGVQARSQLEAICSVRPIEQVWVYSLNPSEAEVFAAELAGQDPIPDAIRVAKDPRQAVQDADIVCTATTSFEPVFPDDAIAPGTHINAIGAFTLEMQEIPPETVARARVFIDEWHASQAEAGDLVKPLKAGLIDEDWLRTELGMVIAGQKPGRTDRQQITLFKSVGVALQDVMATQSALQRAGELEIGAQIEL